MPSRLASSRSCCRWPLRMSRCRSCSSMRLLRSSSESSVPSSSGRRLAKRSSWSSILSRLIHSGLRLIATSSRRARAASAFDLGLAAIDFVGQLAELHRRLGPAAALGDQLIELAAKLLALARRACESPTSRPHELSSRSRVPSSMWITS